MQKAEQRFCLLVMTSPTRLLLTDMEPVNYGVIAAMDDCTRRLGNSMI